jgi:hypothetical protein
VVAVAQQVVVLLVQVPLAKVIPAEMAAQATVLAAVVAVLDRRVR